ncbi:MAG: SH3 domain-containing protein [Lachnospiraceae bacterium]|nr:SH3 domain-containing protein [Lachnospiraceae bacterium]
MRHSRRAVMTERYKLYAKKNILNSRYLVRNVQISLLVLVVVAMVIGTIMLVNTDVSQGEVALVDTKVSVKDALFTNTEEVKKTTEAVTTEQETTTAVTESVIAEKVKTELSNTITDVVSSVAPAEEEKKEEPKSEFDNKCIANVDDTLNIRKDPSAEAEFVGQMNNGAIAIVQGTEGEWTKIKSGDVEGYVLTEYVLTGVSAEEFAKDYVTLRGTVLEDGVNIRADKSTDAEILTVMDKDDTITVLENPKKEEVTEELVVEATTEDKMNTEVVNTVQATTEVITTEMSVTEQLTEAITEDITKKEVVTEEEIDWIPVMLEDGQTGYVSAELITVDELYEIAISAEELQRRADEEAARLAEEAARKAAEEAARQAAAATQSAPQSNNNTSSGNNNTSYEGATTTPTTVTESGEYVGTFTITAYCGCNKCGTGSNRTASGTTPTEGRTIAADTSMFPFGTQLVIGGVVYTVEDSGSGVKGNHIDIFFATHSRALAFGRKTMKVYKY